MGIDWRGNFMNNYTRAHLLSSIYTTNLFSLILDVPHRNKSNSQWRQRIMVLRVRICRKQILLLAIEDDKNIRIAWPVRSFYRTGIRIFLFYVTGNRRCYVVRNRETFLA